MDTDDEIQTYILSIPYLLLEKRERSFLIYFSFSHIIFVISQFISKIATYIDCYICTLQYPTK